MKGDGVRSAAEQIPPHARTVSDDRGAEWVPRVSWLAAAPIEKAMAAETAPASNAVTAYGNEGRWVAECPDCRGAQIACMTDRRFMCNECANAAIGGLWRPTVWPVEAAEIAEALDPRHDRNRNWLPGETVADLLEENDAHGLIRKGV